MSENEIIMPVRRLKFVVWGAGRRGQRVYDALGSDYIEAFIDSNINKINSTFNGKPVISFEDYETLYKDTFIIISALIGENEIESFLKDRKCYKCFLLSDNPQELLNIGYKDIIKNLPFQYEKNLKTYVCGKNLFAILLYDYLLTIGCDVYLTFDGIEHAEERCQELIDFVGDRYCTAIDDSKLSNVFITSYNCNRTFLEKQKAYNCFDFSHQIKHFYHKELENFHNIHIGQRCFIVATGPSLKIEDLNVLKDHNEKSFSMNRIYECFTQTKWRPDFYCVSDPDVYRQHKEDIDKLTVKNVFISAVELENENINKNFYRYHHDNSSYKFMGRRYSENIAVISYSYGSVLHICLQFAMYMGFKEIYLMGVDFDYKTMGKSGNHFYKNESKKNNAFDYYNCLAGYQAAKQYADTHGIKIYNATRGGKLEVFPRVYFDSLFKTNDSIE